MQSLGTFAGGSVEEQEVRLSKPPASTLFDPRTSCSSTMSAQTQSLRRSFLSAAQSWPVDKLRPTLNFGAALEAATTRIFDNPSPSASPALKQLTPSQLLKAERTFISLQNLMTDTARNAVR